jgi:hypothetical protein
MPARRLNWLEPLRMHCGYRRTRLRRTERPSVLCAAGSWRIQKLVPIRGDNATMSLQQLSCSCSELLGSNIPAENFGFL